MEDIKLRCPKCKNRVSELGPRFITIDGTRHAICAQCSNENDVNRENRRLRLITKACNLYMTQTNNQIHDLNYLIAYIKSQLNHIEKGD